MGLITSFMMRRRKYGVKWPLPWSYGNCKLRLCTGLEPQFYPNIYDSSPEKAERLIRVRGKTREFVNIACYRNVYACPRITA